MRINLVGFGVIGKGFAKTLIMKQDWLKSRYGFEPRVVSISDLSGTLVNPGGIDLSATLETVNRTGRIIDCSGASGMQSLDAIRGVEADLMVEVTPTNVVTGEPGLSHMLTAMDAGKHVVTSNKGPLALAYKKLKAASEKKGVQFKFESSAGGAMPLINLANEVLSGDEIISIKGILNGTTNFILTKMTKEGTDFETTLKEAQELGIAETDPSYDISGSDTASKLVILTNAILGREATYSDVSVQGITKITPEAIALAKEEGFVIKLIGEVEDGRLSVAPQLVPENHPLNVDGTLNVASFTTDLAGDVTIVGRGAGAIETNSAILSDILSIYRGVAGR
ncbi:homoserine dehydrogenase [archaeon BMS3Abin16]|nr:homoserine dehydrogenase [archaeon BMS3Abin16]GBE56490.1 homoserine dehydrogenase [archaeon BMS3Bbin16]HDY73835.1 homoserine dehydrogenase [Euryarchaeota archaeon]